MAQRPTRDALRQLDLVVAGLVDSPQLPIVVQVLSVHRFLWDAAITGILPQSEAEDISLYELRISDGQRCCRVIVHPKLNARIDRDNLGLALIRVMRGSVRYDEATPGSTHVIFIEEYQLLERRSNIYLRSSSSEDLEWTLERDAQHLDKPIIGNRSTFINLYSLDVPEDYLGFERDRDELRLQNAEVADFVKDRVALSTLSTDFKLVAGRPFIGRVLRRSGLICSAKATDNLPYPFQAYIELADGSATVVAVLWYKVVPVYFARIEPGDLVVIGGYRAQHASTYVREFAPDTKVEISLNSRNPQAVIRLLTEVQMATLVPQPAEGPLGAIVSLFAHSNFIRRTQLVTEPDNALTDVVGLIAYVSPEERRRIRSGFHRYRWVLVLDGSSQKPFAIQLSCNSQLQTFNRLSSGTMFMCTNCKVLSWSQLKSHGDRGLHLTSTPGSYYWCASVDDVVQKRTRMQLAALEHDEVKDVFEWAATPEAALQRERFIQPYPLCPWPLPPAQVGRVLLKHIMPMTCVTMPHLLSMAEALALNERKRAFVQGTIHSLTLFKPDVAFDTLYLSEASQAAKRSKWMEPNLTAGSSTRFCLHGDSSDSLPRLETMEADLDEETNLARASWQLGVVGLNNTACFTAHILASVNEEKPLDALLAFLPESFSDVGSSMVDIGRRLAKMRFVFGVSMIRRSASGILLVIDQLAASE